jgi:uncharacterized protein DUF1320
MKTLVVQLDVTGASIVLTDQAGTYGIKNPVTGHVYVAAGALSMTETPGGSMNYQVTFDAVAAGINPGDSYQYSVRITFEGAVTYEERTVLSTLDAAVGIYINQGDLQSRIPPDDFLELTDRTHVPQTTPDISVIQAAIDAGESRLHRKLGRRYLLPLNINDAILMKIIKPMIVDFAWEALYPRSDMADATLLSRTALHDKYLNEIRDGLDDLPASSPPAAASQVSQVQWSADCRRIEELP